MQEGKAKSCSNLIHQVFLGDGVFKRLLVCPDRNTLGFLETSGLHRVFMCLSRVFEISNIADLITADPLHLDKSA